MVPQTWGKIFLCSHLSSTAAYSLKSEKGWPVDFAKLRSGESVNVYNHVSLKATFHLTISMRRQRGVCLKCGLRSRVQKCGSRIQKSGSVGRKCELSKVRVAGCRARDASYESRDTICDCQMSRDWGIVWRTFVPL